MTAGAPAPMGWMVRGTMLFTNVPQAVAFGAPAPVLAVMSNILARDADDAYLVKMVVGILGVAMLIGAPIAGWLTDRIGRGPLLLGSGLIFACAGIAPLFTDDLGLILVTRFFVGLSAMAFSIAGTTLIGDRCAPSDQPRWMGFLVSTALVGALLTTPIAGFLGDVDWRWPFLLHLVGIPGGIIGWLGSDGPRLAKTATVEAIPIAAADPVDEITGPRAMVGLVLLSFAIGVMIYLPTIYVPFHLAAIGFATPSAIGLLLTVRGVVSALIAGQFGRARKYLSAERLFCLTFAGTALGMVLLATAPNLPLVIIGMIFVGAGAAWLSSNLFAVTVSRTSEHRRGRVMGWVAAAKSLAPAIGVTAVEPLVRVAGVDGVLLLLGGIAALIAVATALSASARNGTPAPATK